MQKQRNDALNAGASIYLDDDGCPLCYAKSAARYVINDACVGCLTRSAYANIESLHPRSRKEALQMAVSSYYAFRKREPQLCADGPHLLMRGLSGTRCVVCLEQAARVQTPRQRAKAAGALEYDGPCDTCGKTTPHATSRGCCLLCYRLDGVRRSPARQSPRAAARRDGRSSYEDQCAACGAVTTHGILHGKCLACYRTDGLPRARSLTGARAAARRDGRKTYPAHCAACQMTREHGVQRGKCLTCYTVDGLPRGRQALPPRKTNPRPIPQEWVAVIAAMPGGLMEWAQAQALGSPLYRGADGVLRWVDTHLEADAERDRYRWG